MELVLIMAFFVLLFVFLSSYLVILAQIEMFLNINPEFYFLSIR